MLHTILWTLTGVLIVVIALAAICLVIVVAGALATTIRDLRDAPPMTGPLERLAILRKSQGDSGDWKKLAAQCEQQINTTNPPTVPETPEEQK